MSRCVCVRRAAFITYRLHAALVWAGGEGNALYPVLLRRLLSEINGFNDILLLSVIGYAGYHINLRCFLVSLANGTS